MFRKPFSVKSSVNLRHSERKAIFPANVNACFNAKQQFVRISVTSTAPLLTASSTNLCCLYALNKVPFFFQCPPDDPTIFPTVYFLWSDAFHDQQQFPVLFVHSSLLPILQNGSDLMIPGILVDSPFADFEPNAPVSIAIIGEEGGNEMLYGPVAVGKSLISSSELREKRRANERGKAIKILHVHGDSLWEFGPRKSIPKMTTTPPTSGRQLDDRQMQQQVQRQDNASPAHQQQPCQQSSSPVLAEEEGKKWCAENGSEEKEAKTEEEQHNQQEQQNVQREMDELLKNTFFTALRWKFGPTGPLPIDAGQFYANYILKCLAPGRKLEIKKTRFKKFSNFLRELSATDDGWMIRLKSVKGVDTIEQVNIDHPLVQSAPELLQIDAGTGAGGSSGSSAFTDGGGAGRPLVSIRDNVFSLTDRVMPIFRPYGFSKGNIVGMDKIRAVLIDYAQKKNLCRNDGKQIELDDTLQPVVQHFLHDQFDVNKLVQKLASTMTQAMVVTTTEGKQIVHRGTKTPHIDLKIERRAGNKVVTLVSNLAMYGIDANALGSEIRGTGTSILASAPACDGPQLLVQGNEINRIGRLLTAFGVPTKFVTGLDQGIKEPKKKKK